MAGTSLAVIAVVIMVAFGQIWKEKGLFWRAGLICAMMKSVSPSAVLLGPMTGIFMEAVLMSASLYIFGRNFLGFLLGGVLALYSVVIHKVISVLFVYGFDLIRITKNLYEFSARQLHIENVSFVMAFFILSSIYIILGIIATTGGYIFGKKILKLKKANKETPDITLDKDNEFISSDKSRNSIPILFGHIIFIILSLLIMNMVSSVIAIVMIIFYSVACILYYKRPLRYLKKPGFWIQILIFAFTSAIFYNGFNESKILNYEGILAGINMAMRAILIVISFSAISSELRNPLIKAVLYRRGFQQFYTSLGLAFSALPYLLKNSANPKQLLRKPFKTLQTSFLQADKMFLLFKKTQLKQKKVVIVTGEKHEGKTTFLINLVNDLKQSDIKIGGFVAHGKFENNKRSEFELENIKTAERKIICSIRGYQNQKKTGPFYFYETGLNFGNEILKYENLKDIKFAVVDEIGPFELRGQGWTNAIDKLLEQTEIIQIWTVRKSLVYDVLRKFGINKAYIFDISQDNKQELINHLIRFQHTTISI